MCRGQEEGKETLGGGREGVSTADSSACLRTDGGGHHRERGRGTENAQCARRFSAQLRIRVAWGSRRMSPMSWRPPTLLHPQLVVAGSTGFEADFSASALLTLGDKIILWGEAPLCTVGCCAACPASTHQMPVAPLSPVVTTKYISGCGQVACGGQNRRCENLWA